MSGTKGTLASRELLAAGVPQIPDQLEREILRGVQIPSQHAQLAGQAAIEQAKQALREKHLAEKRLQTPKGRGGY